MDLFNNPMIEAAKKAMTPEQLEEYKNFGKYMYNTVDYGRMEATVIETKPTVAELARYAETALKSGAMPSDLSEPELQALSQVYGEKWYEKFDFKPEDVPKQFFEILGTQEALAAAVEQAKKHNLCRQQRRALERKLEKEREKLSKKKA